MGVACISNKELADWDKTRSEIWDHWASKKNIGNRFFDSVRGEFMADASVDSFKYFISERIELPFDRDFPLSDTLVKRIKIEIDEFDRNLRGNFGNFVLMVPEGNSKKDPTARKFYNKLNEILNHERVQVNSVSSISAEIAAHMSEGYMQMHKVSGIKGRWMGDKALKELREIRKIMATSDPSEATIYKWETKMEDLINSNEGVTLKQYHELIRMDRDTFKEAEDPSYVDPTTGQKVIYNSQVYQAATKSRELLDIIGGVYTNGLTNLKRIIALKYTNESNVKQAAAMNDTARRYFERIDESIAGIKRGIKKGGYFPEASFENMMMIKEGLSKAMAAGKIESDIKFTNLVDNILSKISLETIPDHARGKNPSIKTYWEKDPLLVLKEYGDQATQFNKSIFTQIEYLEALKQIPNMKDPTRFVKGLKQFISEEYAIFTRGVADRPAWANKAVSTFNAFQTARTMGLNLTGALKNAASAMNYYSRVGLSSIQRTYNAKVSSEKIKGGFAEALTDVESEMGFKFKDAAVELYTEGLITRDMFEGGEIEYNPFKGTITMNEKPVQDALVKMGKWTLDKGLFFHRLTENNQRKWMFRTSFHEKYTYLLNNGYDKGKAKTFAKNFALKTVNGWAYEYAAHAKARPVRGQWGTVEQLEEGTISRKLQNVAGAGSEIAFHLLHYPMSLFESQYSVLKGAHKARLAGQGFESQDIQHLARYGGMVSLIGLVSAFTNTDLFNIMENETVERVGRVLDDLTQYDNPKKGTFGLMSEFTGPTIGMFKYLSITGGLIDIEDSDLNKILFGNVDFADPTDRNTELYNAYQYSTAYGVIKNKVWPSLKHGRGRDLIMHYGKLYPSKWTKAGHEVMFGKQPSRRKKKKTPVSEAVRILDLMLE